MHLIYKSLARPLDSYCYHTGKAMVRREKLGRTQLDSRLAPPIRLRAGRETYRAASRTFLVFIKCLCLMNLASVIN